MPGFRLITCSTITSFFLSDVPLLQVKNAMAKTTDSVKQVASERPLKIGADSSVPTPMTLAMFAKKTPKVKASLLANYIKRYNSHGFVIMSFSQSMRNQKMVLIN